MPISKTPFSELLGVEVSGVDCRTPPDVVLRADIFSTLHTHQGLAFREQTLSKDELIAFSEAFGELEMHVNEVGGGYERPNFHTVTNLDKNGNILPPLGKGRENNNPSSWHSEKSYMPRPSMATFLRGIEVTREGGETLFASLTHAYDALEDAEKARLKQLRRVHHWAQSLRNSDSRLATAAEEQI